MSPIRFDSVLRRADTAEVVAAVGELEQPRSLAGRGIAQSSDGLVQFAFAVDQTDDWWELTCEDGRHEDYREGTYSYRSSRNHEHVAAEFFRPMPQALQMLWPTRLLTWANPHGSFYPVLAQSLGRHSILFTFEHVDDPAYRQTLVMDARSGIATRLIGLDHALIITSIEPLARWDHAATPAFEPLTGPPEPDY